LGVGRSRTVCEQILLGQCIEEALPWADHSAACPTRILQFDLRFATIVVVVGTPPNEEQAKAVLRIGKAKQVFATLFKRLAADKTAAK
jgi:hypothetical protein